MEYIRVEYTNVEPIRIADDSKSQSGQSDTLAYIPGSTMRGIVINALARQPEFTLFQKELFSSDVRFMNGYVMQEDETGLHEMIPSLKGFYENKVEQTSEKEIESILLQEKPTPGFKRATVGDFCYLVDDRIVYTRVEKNSDLKINIGKADKDKKNVFRNQYICEGYTFVSYIAVKNEQTASLVKSCLEELQKNGGMLVGNARSNGHGKCLINDIKISNTNPYENIAASQDLQGSAFLLLLSDTAMINELGENVGINLSTLEKLLEIQNLKIETCSSSVKEIRGYNRLWGVKIPSEKMYEMGSIFKISFDGIISAKCLQNLYSTGIGIRRNEGFGQVICLKDYQKINKKIAISEKLQSNTNFDVSKLSQEELTVLKMAAKTIYMKKLKRAENDYICNNGLKKGNVNRSQLGAICALAEANRYAPEKAIEVIKQYLDHCADKDKKNNQHNTNAERTEVIEAVKNYLNKDAEKLLLGDDAKGTTLGINNGSLLSEREKQMLRINLLLGVIKYDNRKEKSDNA